MRLVVVTQQVDPASPVLGATVAKLRALAARVDELVVLADSAVEGVLPANCRVRPFRAARRAGRGLRFESALARELARRPRPAAVLAHMCPIYAVLAAPVARPLRVPVLLWFTHWRRSRLLSTAELLSNRVLSVDERTFPLRSKKVVAIGHGIDVSDLPCVARPARDELMLLALGRREEPAPAPVREPQQHGHAQGPCDRRGEDGIDRAHMRENGARPGPPNELPRERIFEAEPAACPVTGPEQPHAAVVGQHAVDGAVRENDQLVDARGEGAELGDRGPEHRARGVDLLRDDDEPHARRASTARPTSSATRSAYSLSLIHI